MRSAFDKERALALQKMEFMEVQLAEGRKQMDENRKAHDAIMKAFESSSSDSSARTDSGKL